MVSSVSRLSRRALLLGGLAGATLPVLGPAGAGLPASADMASPAGGARRRIVSMDFGLAETLIEMGIPPIAVPNPEAWATWVVEPELPPDIINIGTDREPNLELLSALKPEMIVSTPYLAGLLPLLEAIAPTRTYSVYAPPGGQPYKSSVQATREMARDIGAQAAGEALIARAEAQMAHARHRLAETGANRMPVLVLTFFDARHVRVYGAGSLFGDVMEQCGLINGWPQTSNYWGFNTIGLEQLASVHATRVLCLEPISPDTRAALAASPLWNSLPVVRSGNVQIIPPVLMFGMLPAAMRFARQLVLHLADGQTENGRRDG